MEKYQALASDELVGLYQAGDNKAFDVLLARHQEPIFQYILMLSNGDVETANDVFQDTFVRVITAVRENRYQANGQFQSWAMRIARNIALDGVRSRKVRHVVDHEQTDEEGNLLGDLLNNQQADELNAEGQLIVAQFRDDMREMVNRLPQVQREVVSLRFYQELSFKEIAEITGVSINTALGRVRYALMNLKRMADRSDLYLVG